MKRFHIRFNRFHASRGACESRWQGIAEVKIGLDEMVENEAEVVIRLR
nr:hypothetical protein [Agrobacterium tumefaciens]